MQRLIGRLWMGAALAAALAAPVAAQDTAGAAGRSKRPRERSTVQRRLGCRQRMRAQRPGLPLKTRPAW